MASRAAAARPPARVQSIWRTTARFGRTWPYLLPALFFFVGWQLWPILRALWISFTSFSFLLDDSPGAFELVKQLLGHENMKTTTNFYAGIDTRRAARHHHRLLQREIEKTKPLHGRLPRKPRKDRKK